MNTEVSLDINWETNPWFFIDDGAEYLSSHIMSSLFRHRLRVTFNSTTVTKSNYMPNSSLASERIKENVRIKFIQTLLKQIGDDVKGLWAIDNDLHVADDKGMVFFETPEDLQIASDILTTLKLTFTYEKGELTGGVNAVYEFIENDADDLPF